MKACHEPSSFPMGKKKKLFSKKCKKTAKKLFSKTVHPVVCALIFLGRKNKMIQRPTRKNPKTTHFFQPA